MSNMAEDQRVDADERTEPGARLASEIRRRRRQANLSQPELAALVGYTRQYVSLAERPGKGLASIELVRALDRALGAGGELISLREAAGIHRRQLRSETAAASTLACTGWLAPTTGAAVPHQLAICGSRGHDTDGALIDDVVRSLGSLLMELRCVVHHGPVGVGIEVMTYVADHYRPPGFERISGMFGHVNVVRDASWVLVIGGGSGTLDEVDIAHSMRKKVLPLHATGGTAAHAFESMSLESAQRQWLANDRWQALRSISSGQEYARIVETLLREDQMERHD